MIDKSGGVIAVVLRVADVHQDALPNCLTEVGDLRIVPASAEIEYVSARGSFPAGKN